VVWTFVWREYVWMVVGKQCEIGAAVLQRETAAFGDDPGAETAVVAVYEGGGVAFGVGDGEVDCIGRR